MAQTIGSIDLASLKNLRDDVTQYFWFESNSGSAWGSGAHVTLYPESQFTDSTNPNYMKGQNIIMNTDGFSIRNGGLPMMVLDNDSLDFNAIDTSLGTYTTMATFGLNGVQIGQINGGNFVIDGNGMQMRDGNQNVLANFSLNEVQIGASNESNITITGNGILGNSSVGNMFGIYPDGTSISRSISTYVYMYDQYTPTIETIDLLDNISNGNTFTAKITPRRSSYTTSGTYTLTKGTPQTINAPVNYNYAKLTYDGDKTIEFGWVSGVMWYDVEIKVVTTTPAPYYTFGYREDDSTNGAFSMSIGVNNEPSGNYTFTHGADLVADHALQFAIGRWNDYLSATDALFIIGNGTALQRSNALTVDWGGNVNAAGQVYQTVEQVTPSITTGSGTLNGATLTRCGNLRQLTLTVSKSTATAVGSSVYTGTLTNTADRPITNITGASYYGSSCLCIGIANNGNITVRVTGAQLAANSSATIGILYIAS